MALRPETAALYSHLLLSRWCWLPNLGGRGVLCLALWLLLFALLLLALRILLLRQMLRRPLVAPFPRLPPCRELGHQGWVGSHVLRELGVV